MEFFCEAVTAVYLRFIHSSNNGTLYWGLAGFFTLAAAVNRFFGYIYLIYVRCGCRYADFAHSLCYGFCMNVRVFSVNVDLDVTGRGMFTGIHILYNLFLTCILYV